MSERRHIERVPVPGLCPECRGDTHIKIDNSHGYAPCPLCNAPCPLDNLPPLHRDAREMAQAVMASRAEQARRHRALSVARRYADVLLFLPAVALVVLAAWLTGWPSGAVGVIGWSWFAVAGWASVAVPEES